MLNCATKICSPCAHTLQQCPQCYDHMLLYHMLLRAASVRAQIPAAGMNWGGEQMKLYIWHVSTDSSLFLFHALIVQKQGLQNMQHAQLETELAANLGPEKCTSAE